MQQGKKDNRISSTVFFSQFNAVLWGEKSYTAIFLQAGPEDIAMLHIFSLFTYTVSSAQTPVLQKILLLDDIFIIITHYKEISGSEVIKWQTHHKCFPKSMLEELRGYNNFLWKRNRWSWFYLGLTKPKILSFLAHLTSKIIKHKLPKILWIPFKNSQVFILK